MVHFLTCLLHCISVCLSGRLHYGLGQVFLLFRFLQCTGGQVVWCAANEIVRMCRRDSIGRGCGREKQSHTGRNELQCDLPCTFQKSEDSPLPLTLSYAWLVPLNSFLNKNLNKRWPRRFKSSITVSGRPLPNDLHSYFRCRHSRRAEWHFLQFC